MEFHSSKRSSNRPWTAHPSSDSVILRICIGMGVRLHVHVCTKGFNHRRFGGILFYPFVVAILFDCLSALVARHHLPFLGPLTTPVGSTLRYPDSALLSNLITPEVVSCWGVHN